jgi:hypothetical protein
MLYETSQTQKEKYHVFSHIYGNYVESVFHHCDKIPKEDNLNDQRFILAHSFRVLVNGHMTTLLWDHVEQNNIAGNVWCSTSAYLMVARKQREQG